MQSYYEDANPFQDDRKYSADEILSLSDKFARVAERVTKKITQAEEKRQERQLIKAMQELALEDDDDPMETNITHGTAEQILFDTDGNAFSVNPVRGVFKKK